MCDTLFKRDDKNVIFGKNSDRGCNEPNLTIFIPAMDKKPKTVDCTYITIPEVSSTYACTLVKPSWMWGAEMGINEHNVAIGNEAVFTKRKNKIASLIGMDYVRLALERGKSAEECVNIILSLLDEYSQGGNCGFDKNFYYDNSFLIADPKNAYIIETCGKKYVVKLINTQGNISNRLSLNGGYCKTNCDDGVMFAKTNSDKLYTYFAKSRLRQQCGEDLLNTWVNTDVLSMMITLKSHTSENDLYTKGSVGSICMHQSVLGDHTTGSMVVNLAEDFPTVWITGCSTPCLSLFKPTFLGALTGPLFDDEQKSLEYWLKREYLLRGIYGGHINETAYRIRLLALQSQWIDEEKALREAKATKDDFIRFAKSAAKQEEEFIDSYADVIRFVKHMEVPLPRLWEKKTQHLGKNVFARELTDRKSL